MAAIAAYRNLFRAVRIAFKGDESILNAAQYQIRTGFRENASLDPTNPAIPEHIKHAEDVATILRRNVVQGQKDGEAYKLRIHEYTERGDNDTVKMPPKPTPIDGKTSRCGGSQLGNESLKTLR
ncbi:mitochondrial zinc maintenance protein 1, mitochondrial [Pseudomassariella vexata]|uniref:Mitochondrial zinc maintenance protein 1, mitochondrial n=1 Tax=Pseudomassariella vexata TaxID=1141098 RepID=A0A1Y2E8H0_9PEZI|nr:mitochondrial zinc maintenance protein 1, mitochondrial [Pseudomassariella vexata]ORY67576.1 mitochondrial zinc maintenance protein 1, mitochondrial [Pseudomassariella vexata]